MFSAATPLSSPFVLHQLAVFCGSRAGLNPAFVQDANQLGQAMAQYQVGLVYGGGGKGLMGAVADAVLAGQGQVIGVIPEVLVGFEAQHPGVKDMRIVSDMHVRKKLMYELCDAALILPGGNGTLDELFEMLTWNTLKIHNKKIFVLNTHGFYDHLVAHMGHMQDQGFLYEEWSDRLVVVNAVAEFIAWMAANTSQIPPAE